jgi:hypothetical protein
MRVLTFEPYPIDETYDSFESAIIGAENHPLLSKARADLEDLAGTRLVDS